MSYRSVFLTFSTLYTLALFSLTSGIHGLEDQRNKDHQTNQSLGDGLIRSDGSSYFLGEQQIRQALAQSYESLRDNSGLYTNREAAHDRISGLVKRSQNTSQLDEDGCVRPHFFDNRELKYQRHPDSFEDIESYNLQTPIDLSHEAPEIVIVQVEAVEPGLISAELGTLARFSIEEWVKRDPERDQFGESSFFFSPSFQFEWSGTTYCQKYSGFKLVAVGDRWIAFGYRYGDGKLFNTGNLFPMDGDIILPQPYPHMESTLPILVGQLKEAVAENNL
ncbi:MAG: hypothetical protein AAGD01_03585 [Acidobacteriota bacterium]